MMGWLILIAATGGGGLIGHAAFGAEGGVVTGVGGSAKRQHRGQLKAPFCCLIGIAVALEAQKQLAVVPGREGIIGQGH